MYTSTWDDFVNNKITKTVRKTFLGIVYFTFKRKLPMLVIEGYEYRMRRKTEAKTVWTCTRECQQCKAKLFSFSNNLQIVNKNHNHPTTFTGKYDLLKSQYVNIL